MLNRAGCRRGFMLETVVQGDTKKQEILKTPIKIEEIQEKIFIDRN